MDLPRTKSLQLVIPTAPTSLRAYCCSGQKYYRLRFCFARWCRLFLISSQNFPPCVYGLAQEQTIPLFRHSETKRLAELLRNAGADVTMRHFHAGHELT